MLSKSRDFEVFKRRSVRPSIGPSVRLSIRPTIWMSVHCACAKLAFPCCFSPWRYPILKQSIDKHVLRAPTLLSHFIVTLSKADASIGLLSALFLRRLKFQSFSWNVLNSFLLPETDWLLICLSVQSLSHCHMILILVLVSTYCHLISTF